MTYLRHLDAETKGKLRAAKRKAAQESKADRLKRARELLAAKETALRKPRERDNEHLQFVRRARCIACLVLGEAQTTPTRAAHIRCSYPAPGWPYTGKAEKPSDHRTAPLCDMHHTDGPDAQHKANERDWWARLRIDPPALCAALVAARKASADPVEAVESIAASIRGFSPSRTRKHAEDAR